MANEGPGWRETATGEAHGYRWQVIRYSLGNVLRDTDWQHNGYVGIPEGHPWRTGEVSAEAVAVVHGGVTHEGTVGNFDGWCVGFDCGHLGDLRLGEVRPWEPEAVFRDEDYAIRQCERLCAQAYAVELIARGDPVRRFARPWEFYLPAERTVISGALCCGVTAPTFAEIREVIRALRRESR